MSTTDYIVATTTSGVQTISSGLSVNLDISKTGYTPVGIVGFRKTPAGSTSSTTAVLPSQFYLDGTTARFVFQSTSERTFTLTVYVLYKSA